MTHFEQDLLVESHMTFTRDQWAALRAATPLDLKGSDLAQLRGINEHLDIDEIVDIYLPLSRLLNLHVVATREQSAVTETFLGALPTPTPYIIGVAGSVAVGKSTTARILQALLSCWPAHPRVELVPTDGFLHPNRELAARGLEERKGFPESYDARALIRFLGALKAGDPEVAAPMYSHLDYDVVEGQVQMVVRPDIVIVEGLNVLQSISGAGLQVADFFDFTVYVDADEADIRRWFTDRFHTLRSTVFKDPASFFHRFAAMDGIEADRVASMVWDRINGPNLRDHILPTRARARLVLEKGPDHRVRSVRLRRV